MELRGGDIDELDRMLLGTGDDEAEETPRARRISPEQLALEQALGVGGHGG